MIYLVVPEGIDDADEWNLWASQNRGTLVQGYPSESAAADQARKLAKEIHRAFTVRKVSTVSFHPGRP